MSIIKPKVFWPVTITASNRVIPFQEAVAGNLTANVATGTYYSAEALRAAVQTAMRTAHANVNALVVAVSSTGFFSFTNATSIYMRWSVTTNSMYQILGATNVDTASALSITNPYQHQYGWYSAVAPSEDSLPIRNREMDVVTRTVEGQTKYLSESELVDRFIKFKWLAAHKTYIAYESTNVNQAIERWWQDGRSHFRYWPDAATEATYYDYVLDFDTSKDFRPKRQTTNKALYEIEMGMMGFVS